MMSTLTAEEVDACIDDLAFSLGELKTSDAEGPLPIEENEEYTHAILERHKELFAKSEDKKIATCIKYHRRGNVPDWALFICTPAYHDVHQIRCVALETDDVFEVRVMKVGFRPPPPTTMKEARHALDDLAMGWILGPESPSYVPMDGDTPLGNAIPDTTNVFWPLVDAGYTINQDIKDEKMREVAEEMLRFAQDHASEI